MKAKSLLLGILFSFALFSVHLNAQTVSITSASLSPNPASCSTNTVTVNVMVGCINYPYVNTTFLVTGNVIDVSVNYSGGAICLGAIVNNTHTSNMPVVSGGTYTVNIRTYLNGVLEASWAPQTWTVASCGPDASFNLSTTSICVPDSIVATNTSLASTSYSWYLNGALVSNDTNEVFYPTNPGPNVIMLIASDGVTQDTSTQNVDVLLAAPVIDLGNDTLICSEDSIVIGIGSVYTNMLWSTGDTIASLNAGPGTYSITVSEPETCESSDTISIGTIMIDSFEVSTATEVNCDFAELEATFGFATYVWSNGASGSMINTINSGTYTVTATTNEGCEVVDSVSVTVVPSPIVDLGNDTLICTNVSWSVLLDPVASGSFLWSDGSSGSILGVTSYGTYWVEVTDNNGCSGTDTIVIGEKTCIPAGTMDQNETTYPIPIFPNPAKDFVEINCDAKDELTLRMISINGQQFLPPRTALTSGVRLDVSELPSGIYTLVLEGNDGVSHHQFVIAR